MSANIFSPVPCCNDGSNQGLDTTHVTHRDFVLLVVARQITVGEKQKDTIYLVNQIVIVIKHQYGCKGIPNNAVHTSNRKNGKK